jgi:hypothetical protein
MNLNLGLSQSHSVPSAVSAVPFRAFAIFTSPAVKAQPEQAFIAEGGDATTTALLRVFIPGCEAPAHALCSENAWR